MLSTDLKSFTLRCSIFLLVTGSILIFAFPIGGALDLYFIQPWVSQTGGFPLRDNWYLVDLNHKIFKKILITFYVSILFIWLASFKVEKLKPYRWQAGYLFWLIILSTSLIGLLKSQSAHACPWNMTHETPTGYIWVFSATHGHCFPGGHASTGFALLVGFFVFRLSNPKIAYSFLILGFIIGSILGWGQMMRGAHFLSHNLWTAWIIFALNTACYFYFYPRFIKNKPIQLNS